MTTASWTRTTQNLKLVHWNVNGWTDSNNELRQRMLIATDADIISLNETHLAGDATVTLPGYHWYGFNRQSRHCRAPITHGGVGIFIRSCIMNLFSVHVIDKCFDGILGLKFVHKTSDFEMIFLLCIFLQKPVTGAGMLKPCLITC